MSAATDIHFVLAYLVALCALVFSWNALGRRVINVALGLQLLSGVVVVAVMSAGHAALPKQAFLHVGGALAALLCYGSASLVGRRSDGGRAALALSALGLACVAVTLYLGIAMQLTGAT